MGVSPSIAGLRWQAEQRLRIGRQANLEVVVNEPSLSRQHAEVRLTPQGWVVQDLGSATGTLLNGVPVGKLTRKLQPEDVLQCGPLTFRVAEVTWVRPAANPSRTSDIRTSGPLLRVQAFSQLSWEQGLQELSLEDARVPDAKQFLTLLRAGYHLSRIDALDELLQSLLDDTVAVLDAQRGAIILLEETTGQLTLKNMSGPRSGHVGRAFSNTLAQRCFSKGESLLCQGRQNNVQGTDSMTREDMSSIICALLRSPRRRLGILHLDRGPMQQPFSEADFKLADGIAATVSVGIESAVAVDKLREQGLQEVTELAQQILANRNPRIAQHSQRVCSLALLLSEALGLPAAERRHLRLGALLHDLGKVGLPDSLLATGGIADTQKEQLRAHPLHGVELAATISGFAPALPVIRSHHERWDGNGYPDGLAGDQIPRLARVVAVADALDYLLDNPLSASAPTVDKALRRCRAEAGRAFDAQVVDVLAGLGPRLEDHINRARPPFPSTSVPCPA
jgi:HD-GYP domain-containing protein (c-di-GMP phosphodiesterase class II)